MTKMASLVNEMEQQMRDLLQQHIREKDAAKRQVEEYRNAIIAQQDLANKAMHEVSDDHF